jgi:uncharacterized membrane protein
MFQKLIFLLLLVLSTLASSSKRSCARQQEGEIIIISEKVGEVIDLEERNKYNLFPDIEGFQSVVFLKLPDGSYLLKVTYLEETTGEEKIKRILRTESSIRQYGSKIDHFENIPAGKYQFRFDYEKVEETKAEKPQVTTVLELVEKKPIIGAFGSAVLGGAACGGAVMGIGALAAGPGEFPYVIPFFSLGVATGATLGIWLWDKENYSPASTFFGAIVPPVIGAIGGYFIAGMIAGEDEMKLGAVVGLFFSSFASPLGATIAYAIHRNKRQANIALLNIKKGDLQAGVPSPILRPVLLLRDKAAWEYHINLIGAEF